MDVRLIYNRDGIHIQSDKIKASGKDPILFMLGIFLVQAANEGIRESEIKGEDATRTVLVEIDEVEFIKKMGKLWKEDFFKRKE